MSLLVEHAGVISGALGLASAFILAWPLVGEIADRKTWQLMGEFKAKRKIEVQEAEALRSIRDRLLDARLGRYRSARLFTLGGLIVLGLAFLFLIIDAATRR